MNIKGLEFENRGIYYPEQYDVWDKNGNMVGYVRLRWGGLSCEYPDVGGEYIYHASIGDGLTGSFEDDEQRTFHLNAIADKILERIEIGTIRIHSMNPVGVQNMRAIIQRNGWTEVG